MGVRKAVFSDRPKLTVSDANPKKCPKSSFEDGLQLCPPIDLFEARGKGLLGKLYLNL